MLMARTSVLQKLGKQVQQHRKAAGLSQETLGNMTELGRSYISGVERGVRNPSIRSLEKIAKVLKVNVSDLTTDL
jgi:transcriptional regulator with XRE-family HTH domain